MGLQFNWVGEDQLDRVAETRMLSMRGDTTDRETYRQRIRADRRAQSGDYLLAEQDGQAVGTATALSMTLWMRGAAFPCQGVAHVGTLKTHRRGGSANARGVASQMMDQVLRKAREREQVVTALMPFRNSYYEHFGYAAVEHRLEWTVPLALLPRGSHNLRYLRDDDREALIELRRRFVKQGQCDIERTPQGWDFYLGELNAGLGVIDRSDPTGPAKSWMYFRAVTESERRVLQVIDWSFDSPPAFIELLHFLGSMKDQYRTAKIWLPRDLPLSRLLRETQLTHYAAPHDAASAQLITRMQIRVLDHKRLLEALHLPPTARGRCIVRVHETEGDRSTFSIALADGRMQVSPSDSSPHVQCDAVQWAAICSGDLGALQAHRLGLIDVVDPAALEVLDVLAQGPAPYCHEYF